jgi:lipid A ethanolaminephosphotransferase
VTPHAIIEFITRDSVRPTLRAVRTLLLLTAIYCLSFTALAFTVSIGEASVVCLGVFLLLAALSFHRLLFAAGWLILCVFTSVADYAQSTYGFEFTSHTISVFFEATALETAEFSGQWPWAAILKGVILGGVGVWLVRNFHPAKNYKIFSLFALLACLLLSMNIVPSPSQKYYPYSILASSYEYLKRRYILHDKLINRLDISKNAERSTLPKQNPLMVVLVIGESVRADHFSLNGYSRKTNPLLETQKNLVNYPLTRSCSFKTSISVPCLLTRATPNDLQPMYEETSIVSLFKKLGFDTAWYGMQGRFSISDPTYVISHEAKNIFFIRPPLEGGKILDEHLLPHLDQEIAKHTESFLVLHTIGSHWQYTNRYPPKFEIFSPVCETINQSDVFGNSDVFDDIVVFFSRALKKEEVRNWLSSAKNCHTRGGLINAYDNSILYTDWLLSQIIDKLKNHNALLLYVSDHGDYLGERKRYGHLYKTAGSEVRHVPMFWWASDEWIAANPGHWQSLKANAPLATSHDNIFHSLLDCADVKSPVIDTALSLCHSHANEKKPNPQ